MTTDPENNSPATTRCQCGDHYCAEVMPKDQDRSQCCQYCGYRDCDVCGWTDQALRSPEVSR
ncbi:hypothetical protein ACWT_6171 [Actinoplanes sp. SE50]|nr:hypothetical protein ACPL_6303 [Actinoplanes sp. SE50/110]ATO85586.1 hypothetical protein ACWT_6171 [Actinoplanes sp. SE50]SLM02999.1 hypothetical protein ACSP50_6284 [Actinoplanes sp. SE50/110]